MFLKKRLEAPSTIKDIKKLIDSDFDFHLFFKIKDKKFRQEAENYLLEREGVFLRNIFKIKESFQLDFVGVSSKKYGQDQFNLLFLKACDSIYQLSLIRDKKQKVKMTKQLEKDFHFFKKLNTPKNTNLISKLKHINYLKKRNERLNETGGLQ